MRHSAAAVIITMAMVTVTISTIYLLLETAARALQTASSCSNRPRVQIQATATKKEGSTVAAPVMLQGGAELDADRLFVVLPGKFTLYFNSTTQYFTLISIH